MNPTLAKRVVDRTFVRLGAPGRYTAPDASTAPCTIILHRRGRLATGARPLAFSGTRLEIAAAPVDVLVRASEVAAPVEGGVFAMLNALGTVIATYTVGGEPLPEDVLVLVWRCTTSSPDLG